MQIFSENEELSDIHSENLRFLLLPFYVGSCYGKVHAQRKISIQKSRLYLNEFIKLMIHYNIIDKKLKDQWKKLENGDNYQVDRDEKKENYLQRKKLQSNL